MAHRTVSGSSRGILGGLAVQYIAGMALNVIGEPEEGSSVLQKTSAYAIFALHGIVALGLIVGSIMIYRQTKGSANEQAATRGMIAVFVSVLAGILTVSSPLGELFSFIMALGFLAAFAFYGKLYFGATAPTKG